MEIKMYAFILDQDSINGIVTYLGAHYEQFSWFKTKFGYDLERCGDLARLAADWDELNCTAFNQRYGTATAADDVGGHPDFEFHTVNRDVVAIYEAVDSLQYQCKRGNVPKLPLYAAFEMLLNDIAAEIICN